MKKLKSFDNHKCAPKEWRGVQDLTGVYTMDSVIQSNTNRDMAEKLRDHLTTDEAYKLNTAYHHTSI